MACKFKKNDYIMDIGSKDIYFVINTLNEQVLVRREKDDEVEQFAESFVNRFCTTVDLETATLLYKDDSQIKKE